MFSEATRTWFGAAFAEPTPAQTGAWEAIAAGRHALVVAPTGSGKTLSAFLWSIDRLLTALPAIARAALRRAGQLILHHFAYAGLGAFGRSKFTGRLRALAGARGDGFGGRSAASLVGSVSRSRRRGRDGGRIGLADRREAGRTGR